jgi:hypothetical protein
LHPQGSGGQRIMSWREFRLEVALVQAGQNPVH